MYVVISRFQIHVYRRKKHCLERRGGPTARRSSWQWAVPSVGIRRSGELTVSRHGGPSAPVKPSVVLDMGMLAQKICIETDMERRLDVAITVSLYVRCCQIEYIVFPFPGLPRDILPIPQTISHPLLSSHPQLNCTNCKFIATSILIALIRLFRLPRTLFKTQNHKALIYEIQ